MFEIFSIDNFRNLKFENVYDNLDQLNNSPYTLLSILSQSDFYGKFNIPHKIHSDNNKPYDIITKTGVLTNGIYSNYSFYSYISVMTHCLLHYLNLDNVYCKEVSVSYNFSYQIYNGFKYYNDFYKNKKNTKKEIIITDKLIENDSIILLRLPLQEIEVDFIIKNKCKVCYQTEYNYDPNLIWLLNYKNESSKTITIEEYTDKVKYDIKTMILKLSSNSDIKNAIESTLLLAKKTNIKLLSWINEDLDEFCKEIINQRFVRMEEVNYKKLSGNNLEKSCLYNKIIYNNESLNRLSYILENTYQYTERTDNKKFMNIELFVNAVQKMLNITLKNVYNININNKIVTRAWIKMYEMLNNFELVKENDNVFFTCEAPGNFISAVLEYTKRKNIKINWNAQSLKTGLQDDYDMIKNNPNNWDIHEDIGDITKFDTFKYYLNKYSGCNLYISDCGTDWTEKTVDLGPYQIVFSLLLPKIGGNAVIKTFMSNTGDYYVSLIYLLTCFYEKVYIFKSNNNMWSNEIYFVLLGKKTIPNEISNNLMASIENFGLSKNLYLVQTLPIEFIKEFVGIELELLKVFIDLKEIMLLFSLKDEYFEKYKENIKYFIKKRNYRWLKKYIDK